VQSVSTSVGASPDTFRALYQFLTGVINEPTAATVTFFRNDLDWAEARLRARTLCICHGSRNNARSGALR